MRITIILLLMTASLSTMRAQQLPKPVLEYKGSVKSGPQFTQFNFAISNYAAYPDELFRPAPDLPPCGRNAESSRSWIEIFNERGDRLYGFCGLQSAIELQKLWFAIPEGQRPPRWIRVVLNDRRTRRTAEDRLYLPEAFSSRRTGLTYFLFGLLLFAGLIGVALAIAYVVPRPGPDAQLIMLVFVFVSLLFTGVLAPAAILGLLSFPLAFLAILLLGLLWRSAGPTQSKMSAIFYWIGVPLIIIGSFWTGLLARHRSDTPGAGPLGILGLLLLSWILTIPLFLGLRLIGRDCAAVRLAWVPLLLNPLIMAIVEALPLPASL